MPVELNKENQEQIIHVSELKDGQIAEIVEINFKQDIGRILFKNGLGISDLSGLCYWTSNPEEDFKVRILKNGETLTIKYNE